jgi:sulfatase maturation enzyme AslB (radical SAM superfamily)
MNTFCPLPFTSIEADPMGKCKVCCLSTETIPNIDLREHTLTDAFHSDYMANLRQQFINNQRPDNCVRCWDEEAAGRTSKRMHSINKLLSVSIDAGTTDLQFLDLKLGNICNLKCRICGSFSSSKWAAEEIAISANNATARANLKSGNWPRNSRDFWTDLQQNLHKVKYFEFTGGEPFLIDEHFDLLEFAVQQGYSHNIEIHYNSNTTLVPDKGLELWPNFKKVEIALSIDDMADRFEYQRYGAVWSESLQNLQKFLDLRASSSNIVLQLCITVSALNVYYLDKIAPWIAHQGFDFVYWNVLHSADHFSIKALGSTAKKIVTDKFANYTGAYAADIAGIMQFMNMDYPDRSAELIRVLKQSDTQRKQKYSDHHPEMARAIGYD